MLLASYGSCNREYNSQYSDLQAFFLLSSYRSPDRNQQLRRRQERTRKPSHVKVGIKRSKVFNLSVGGMKNEKAGIK